MPLVYLDTNVIDSFLRGNFSNLSLFRAIKRRYDFLFPCSIDLLAELSNNPNIADAKNSLKIVKELCSPNRYTYEPTELFQNELSFLFNSAPLTPFRTRTEAEKIFEHGFWGKLTTKRFEDIRAAFKKRNKERFAEEKAEFNAEQKHYAGLEFNAKSQFADIWAAAKSAGYCRGYLKDFVERRLKREPAPDEIENVLNHIDQLHAFKCVLIHGLSYLFVFNIKDKRPDKLGNNMDARHIVAAAYSDFFVTMDQDLLELLNFAEGFWPFVPMSPGQFCSRFHV